MNYLDDPKRELLIGQVLSATTLREVHAAQSALRQWRVRYPEDYGVLDAGEELSLMEEALLEDDSPPGQSPFWTEWQRLEYQVMGARTLSEITAARHGLRQWVQDHPKQTQAEWVETLFSLLDVVEEQQTYAGDIQVLTERELVGQIA